MTSQIMDRTDKPLKDSSRALCLLLGSIVVNATLMTGAFGSTPYSLPWNTIKFSTDRASVSIVTTEGWISELCITLDEVNVAVPREVYADIRYPILSRAELVYSSGVSSDWVVQTDIVLRFPVDEKLRVGQSIEQMPVVELKISNGYVSEKRIKQVDDQGKPEILSREFYEKSETGKTPLE